MVEEKCPVPLQFSGGKHPLPLVTTGNIYKKNFFLNIKLRLNNTKLTYCN